jgi:flavorubredoxin
VWKGTPMTKDGAPEDHNGPEQIREISDGLHWLCGCISLEYKGRMIHSYVAPYLIIGSEKTLMVDSGHGGHWPTVEEKLTRLLDGRKLDYLFATHPEMPHAGNVTRVIEAYPDCQLVGDMRDLHLYFPESEHGFVPKQVGDSLDLGDRTFSFHEAIVRDLVNTQWGFDDKSGVLFVADGFGFAHYHGEGECGQLAEELANEITSEQVTFLNDAALAWIRYTDLTPILARVDALVAELGVRAIAPAHGAVVTDIDGTFAKIRDMMLAGRDFVPPVLAAEAVG